MEVLLVGVGIVEVDFIKSFPLPDLPSYLYRLSYLLSAMRHLYIFAQILQPRFWLALIAFICFNASLLLE